MISNNPIVSLIGVATVLLAACGSDAHTTAGTFDTAGADGSGSKGEGGNGSSFGSSNTENSAKSCAVDADCDDHDDCTHDRCVRSGEFTSCENLSSADESSCSGASAPPGYLDPIDPTCADGASTHVGPLGQGTGGVLFPPFVPLNPDDVPASCNNGFELQQAQRNSVYTLTAKTAQGARAIMLDVDFATYTEPDGMTITAIDASGDRHVLLATCRMRTWTTMDPTGGKYRPPDETIRQFRINVASGTAQLEIKFGQVVSPMYLRIVGLCDFDVTPFASAARWAPVF